MGGTARPDAGKEKAWASMPSHAAAATPADTADPTPGPVTNGYPAGWSWSAEPLPSRDGTIVVLRIGGEIDMLNQPELQTVLTDTLSGRPHHVVVDLGGVTFCWFQGLALLAETAAVATANETARHRALQAVLHEPSSAPSTTCAWSAARPPGRRPGLAVGHTPRSRPARP